MLCRSMISGLAIWAATSVVAYGEIYTWTDAQGTLHFTEDAAAVPAKLRSKARQIEENAAPPVEAAAAPETTVPTETPAVVPPAAESEVKAQPGNEPAGAPPLEIPAFTSLDQWQAELQQREAAMTEVRKRLDELATTVRNTLRRTTERDKLEADYRALLPEYNAMKAHYFRLVEAARKAGFQVDLQK